MDSQNWYNRNNRSEGSPFNSGLEWGEYECFFLFAYVQRESQHTHLSESSESTLE